MLAGFAAAPGRPARGHDGHDGLEDDVATISYEQALRTHARRRPAAALGLPFEPEALAPAESEVAPQIAKPVASTEEKPPASVRISEWAAETKNPALEASRKAASITIRLTQAECDQVHERAAAAGLTASAYLRSCLFEAETLRAQVKEALDQFRTAGPAGGTVSGPASGPANGKKPVRSEGQASDAEHSARRSWLRSRWLGGEGAKSA